METNLENPVNYELPIGDELIYMNHLIGKYIVFKWEKEIYCIDQQLSWRNAWSTICLRNQFISRKI